MARLRKLRPGAFGLALTAWDVWRRLPPRQRKEIMRFARTHGPRIAAKVVEARRARRAR